MVANGIRLAELDSGTGLRSSVAAVLAAPPGLGTGAGLPHLGVDRLLACGDLHFIVPALCGGGGRVSHWRSTQCHI